MKDSVSEQGLSLAQLDDLEKAGLVDPSKARDARKVFSRSIHWRHWLEVRAVLFGILFLLAGIIFFFAANWKAMGPWYRFGVLEGAVALTALVAAWRGIEERAGQLLLLVASVLTGVLLAVYGQVYQTGADAFEVYALWAGLIFVWVCLSNFLPLWAFWTVVAQAALVLFGGQVLVPDEIVGWAGVGLGLSVFCFGILALWEWLQVRSEFRWLGSDWFRVQSLGAALFWISLPPFRAIFDMDSLAPVSSLACLIWVAMAVLVPLFYIRVRRDIVAVGLSFLATCTIIVMGIARFMFEKEWFDEGSWLITALLSLGVFGGAATFLVKLNRQQKTEVVS